MKIKSSILIRHIKVLNNNSKMTWKHIRILMINKMKNKYYLYKRLQIIRFIKKTIFKMLLHHLLPKLKRKTYKYLIMRYKNKKTYNKKTVIIMIFLFKFLIHFHSIFNLYKIRTTFHWMAPWNLQVLSYNSKCLTLIIL